MANDLLTKHFLMDYQRQSKRIVASIDLSFQAMAYRRIVSESQGVSSSKFSSKKKTGWRNLGQLYWTWWTA